MKLIRIPGSSNEHLYRHPKTSIVYFQISRAKRGRLQKSTRTKSLPEARRIADDYRLSFLGVAKIKRGRSLIEDLFPEWIEQKMWKSPATVTSIKLSWKHLKPFIESMLPEEITAKWWESVYVPQKRLLTHPARKFFNDRKWLMMFLLSIKKEGLLESTPELIDVDPPVVAGKVYSDDEIRRLLEHAGEDLRLQILMAVTMGMRIGEIMGLTWDRIDMKSRIIHLRAEDTKIRKARAFGISEVVYKLLVAYGLFEMRHQSSSPLFASPEDPTKCQGRQGNKRAWGTCKRVAKVQGRFHDLRHTFLTNAFKKSVNPSLICHFAGLSLEEAERTYLHFTVEDTRPVAGLMEVL